MIWDLKQKRPLVPFSNPQKKKRYSAIAWNPEQATQVAIASEDDSSPTIELWDVRQTVAPVKELEGHTKGILSISWCPHDSNLLLSCGRDNRTVIWNPNTGEILKELTAANNWMYDVQWASRPSFCSTASFDGRVTVYSLQDSSSDDYGGTEFSNQVSMGAQQLKKSKSAFTTAPKWLQRPCGAVFGFGKLVTFNQTSRQVTINRVTTDTTTADRAIELENVLKNGNYSEFCDFKINSAKSENEKATWEIMNILFEQNKSSKLLQFLGFDKQQISKDIDEKFEHSKGNDNNLGSQEKQEEEEEEGDQEVAAMNPKLVDEIISRAVMVADFEKAVSCCLRAGRMDDALILASCGGPTLWENTKNEYFNRQKRPIMRVISKVLNNKLDEIVGETSLDQWKDTLAIACTFAPKEQFGVLSAALGARLENENQDTQAALVCYMLAGDMEKTVGYWVSQSKGVQDSEAAMLDLVEKVIIFQQTNPSSAIHTLNPTVAECYTEYAKLIASHGLLSAALRYLNLTSNIGNQQSPEILLLRHRIYNSLDKPFGTVPQAPFAIRNIVVRAQQQKTQRQTPVAHNVTESVQRPVVVAQPQPAPFMLPQPIMMHSLPSQPQPYMTQQPAATVPFGVSPPFQPSTPSLYPAPPQEDARESAFKFGLPPSPFVQPQLHPESQAPSSTTEPLTMVTLPHPQPIAPHHPPAEKSVSPAASKAQHASSSKDADNPGAVDISKLEGKAMIVATVLTKTFEMVFSGNVPSQHVAKKRIISKDLVALLVTLVKDEVPAGLLDELLAFANAVDEKKIDVADKLAKDMGTTFFEESKSYQKGLKFLVQTLK